MYGYFIQVMLCSGAFYGYYHFFLRNERFHRYNRFYLLLSAGLSLFLPLLKIPVPVDGANKITQTIEQVVVSPGNIAVAVAVKNTYGLSWEQLVTGLFFLLPLLFLCRFLWSVLTIKRIKGADKNEKMGKITFIVTEHAYAPFSFFNWLFWHKRNRLHTAEGQQILRHELYHIQKRHSVDLVLVEILLCFFWFNPVFYWYRKEIKAIHEFLADQHAAGPDDPFDYARLLITQAIQHKQPKLINPFFTHQLKRRIAMLTKTKKPAFQYLRRVMVLPLFTIMAGLFAFTYRATASLSNTPGFFNYTHLETVVANLFSGKSSVIPGDTLRIYNDQIVSKEAFEKVPFSKIATVMVLSKANTQKLYGHSKAAGALVILGKGYHSKKLEALMPSPEADRNNSPGKIRSFEMVVVAYSRSTPVAAPVSIQPEPDPLSITGGNYFTSTEQPAVYNTDWNQFLAKNVRGEIPVQNGAHPGSYRTAYQFVVEPDGTLSNIKPLTNIGYGMEAEGLRILKKSGRWQPALQNKKAVRSVYIQNIHFKIVPYPAASHLEKKPADTIPGIAQNEEIFTKMEVPPKFNGDWVPFLFEHLDATVAVKHGAPTGNYQAIVQFIIDRKGGMHNVKVIKDPGYGMGAEAMRVVKAASDKWIAGKQNGRDINAFVKQPITFQVK
ncbi:M56 family metallopeptidase [Niabella aurantiaca]|uniref:M56 family metallopeptidase n=1 Tax=Niabella aurantiaca TaxID=379900 RepID=UPI000377C567|nr:M56 family metallopeptidase [Niabella aurantiaca]